MIGDQRWLGLDPSRGRLWRLTLLTLQSNNELTYFSIRDVSFDKRSLQSIEPLLTKQLFCTVCYAFYGDTKTKICPIIAIIGTLLRMIYNLLYILPIKLIKLTQRTVIRQSFSTHCATLCLSITALQSIRAIGTQSQPIVRDEQNIL